MVFTKIKNKLGTLKLQYNKKNNHNYCSVPENQMLDTQYFAHFGKTIQKSDIVNFQILRC